MRLALHHSEIKTLGNQRITPKSKPRNGAPYSFDLIEESSHHSHIYESDQLLTKKNALWAGKSRFSERVGALNPTNARFQMSNKIRRNLYELFLEGALAFNA